MEGCASRFRVLTKLGISSKLQDLLILWGKEVLRGYPSPATSPLPLAQILGKNGLGIERRKGLSKGLGG